MAHLLEVVQTSSVKNRFVFLLGLWLSRWSLPETKPSKLCSLRPAFLSARGQTEYPLLQLVWDIPQISTSWRPATSAPVHVTLWSRGRSQGTDSVCRARFTNA